MDYNLKIQVNHENESSDAQALFFALGGSWCVGGTRFLHLDQPYLFLSKGLVGFDSDAEHFRSDGGVEVTLEALRDLVHAKKNSENEKEMNILDEGRYVEKEYINKTTGEYRKTADVVSGEQWVKLHKKANMAISEGSIVHQWASNDFFIKDGKIIDCVDEGYGKFSDWENDSVLWKWQRPTQPEALNDQYAEIEKVCQEGRHSHYKKDVSGLDFVDVYRVLKLFDVTDPCLQHAVKKLLCSGQRGVKSVDKDIQEAIDSLLRYQEMKKEDLK